jgi:hypothetical protein
MLLIAGVLISGSGCTNNSQFGRPVICDQKSASQRLYESKQFDPYPDPTIGPPILGGRPQGFMEPRPEPDPVKHQFYPGRTPMPYVPAR